MRFQQRLLALVLTFGVLTTGAYWLNSSQAGQKQVQGDKKETAAPAKEAPKKAQKDKGKRGARVRRAVARIQPTKGNKVMGTVFFQQTGKGVKVTATISGLTPGQKHGFHIHQYGYCGSDDGKCTGGHFDPAGTMNHALPGTSDKPHHAGDMGNLEADKEGNASYEATLNGITILGRNGILGRGVIVHGSPDDGGQPTGNAGARIGVGTIGIAMPMKKD